MADTAARCAILARRNEICRFTLSVVGIDLTDAGLGMQVRLGQDVPGAPLIVLAPVTSTAAEGLKFDGVTVTGGVPTSIIRGRINQATMSDATKVPYGGEVGSDTILAYAMVWNINGDVQTRVLGDFIVQPSAYNSDNAPTDRPASYGAPQRAASGSIGSLQFGDQIVRVSLSDADLIAPLLGTATLAATRAETAAATVQTASGLIVDADIGPVPAASGGTAFNNATTYYDPATVSPVARYVSAIRAPIQSAGSATLVVARVEGDGSLSLVSTTALTFSGTGDATPASLTHPVAVPAGAVLGIRIGTATSYYSAGGDALVWTTPGLPSTSTAKATGSGNQPRYRYSLAGEVSLKARAAYETALAIADAVGAVTTIGWPNVVATGSDAPAGYVVIDQRPAAGDGVLSQVVTGSGGSGSATIVVVSVSGGVATIAQSVGVSLVPGVNTFTPNLPVKVGQLVGIVGPLKFQNSANPLGVTIFSKTGGLATGDTVTTASQHRFEVAFTIKTGLLAAGSASAGANTSAGAFIQPRDTRLLASDVAGTWTRSATSARPTRLISDGQGYEAAAPGARISFSVTAAAASAMTASLLYTGLVTRQDTYNPVGSVDVGGVVSDFTCPVAKTDGGPHPVANFDLSIAVPTGTSVVSLIWPYAASLDLLSLALPSGVTLNAAPTRPALRYVVFGDSRVHGFSASKERSSWAHLLGAAKNAQVLNLGYGGRQIVPGDATAAGGLGADAAVYLAGYNNFYPNGASISAIQNLYAQVISSFRSASTAAGKPNAKLVMMSDLWSSSDVGQGGPYAGNSPTLQQFRNAMQAAVSASGDANVVFLSGNTGAMPTGAGSFPDGVHPNDGGSAAIAAAVAAVL